MSDSNSSNNLVVPQAKAAMEQFKMEAASEVGIHFNGRPKGCITDCRPSVA